MINIYENLNKLF